MLNSLFLAWSFPRWVCLSIEIAAIVYWRGWLLIRRTRPSLFPGWRLGCFLAGLAFLFIAIASPIDTFSEQLLFLHMLQHFILMCVVPPLIVLAAPTVPMLRGLPRWFVRPVLGPLIRTTWLRRFFKLLVSPRVAWVLMNASYIGWHIPAAYELALASWQWHIVEHSCFLFTSILFWWPVIQPWPSRFSGSRWLVLPYLLSADIINTVVSASLCFSGRVLYPSYAEQTRMFGISPLSDQAAAGALMWVFGSLVFLVPAMYITMQLLSSPRRRLMMSGMPSH
ncbi:MAG TPA: cytochrome c oxidase assembly protein [Silvibacterium sp.]|jgi:cytochrome c oxidase assembly factor CtaG|nr:cytochrome c oxidase assembly protein [Silvibacterium sp.]